MTYLLDTNTCIYIINKKPPSVVKRIRTKQPEQVAISTITIAELEYGVVRWIGSRWHLCSTAAGTIDSECEMSNIRSPCPERFATMRSASS